MKHPRSTTEWSAFAIWWVKAGCGSPPKAMQELWQEVAGTRNAEEVASALSRVESAAVEWLRSDQAYRWLVTPLDAFAGRTPAEVALSDSNTVIGLINSKRMVAYSPFREDPDPDTTPEDYLATLLEDAVEVFGDDAEEWTRCPQSALEGQTPAEMAVDRDGYERVADFLDKIAWGQAVGEFKPREEIIKEQTRSGSITFGRPADQPPAPTSQTSESSAHPHRKDPV